jgi:hypothetical protein
MAPAVTHKTKSLYRYQAAVRSYLSVTHYDDIAEGLVTKTILATAETMSDPADLINQAVETLQAASIDLPAFSTLDRLVNRLRMEVHTRIYNRVLARVTPEHLVILDALLVKPANSTTTSFNRLKQMPGPATPTTIRLWIERLDWLAGLLSGAAPSCCTVSRRHSILLCHLPSVLKPKSRRWPHGSKAFVRGRIRRPCRISGTCSETAYPQAAMDGPTTTTEHTIQVENAPTRTMPASALNRSQQKIGLV